MQSIKENQPKINEMVQVAVCCRPMNEKEKLQCYINVVKVYPYINSVEIYDPKNEKMDHCKVFTFDAVYDWKCTQQEIYDQMVRPLVSAVLSGFNGTVFAYGQSGTGKTYTMEGNTTNENAKGIIPRTSEQIFDHIFKSYNMQYLVRISFVEIYQDEIKDLLSNNHNKKYELRENKELGVYVKNVSSFVCNSVKEMKVIMATGRRNRTIGVTDMNERSSRSHAVVTITIEMRDIKGPLENRVRVGKLNLVDLAGSERQNKSNTEGKRLREASKINLSLTALGNIISALADNKEQYIPYRDSKLTHLLRDSLGGNAKTLMIANIGPASYNYNEILNTLRYASRARNIKNKPKVNEDPVDALIRKYQNEIRRLKCQLEDKIAVQRLEKINVVKIVKSIESTNDFIILNNLTGQSNTLKTKDNILSVENTFEKNGENNAEGYNEFEEKYVDDLVKRIESMESKLLTGSTSFLDLTSEQQRVLEAQTNEIKESEQREKEMQKRIEMQEETAEEIREEYSNLQQEVEIKSKKLMKIYHKLQTIQQEIQDVKEECNVDRQDLQITEYELLKYLKLKLIIMENFISNEERRRILSRLIFDEEIDTWKVIADCDPANILPRPQCVEYIRRPVTLYTKYTCRKANEINRFNQTEENRKRTFRFKGENILELKLIDASRTTSDYERPRISSALNSIFQTALQVEEDLEIDAMNVLFSSNSSKINSGGFPQSILSSDHHLRATKSIKRASMVSTSVYPTARGLVPK